MRRRSLLRAAAAGACSTASTYVLPAARDAKKLSGPLSASASSDTDVYLDEEFAGPYTGWRNVKTLHGAVGNGTTDDATAFQNALNALSNDNSVCPVLYIPAGTYRMMSTLTRASRRGLTILGEDPATTTILWDGASGGMMFGFQGTQFLRFGRLTLDGNGIAGRLLNIWKQTPDGAGYYFPTGFILEDIHFKDAQFGLSLARHSSSTSPSHGGTAELNIKRCKFTGHSIAAVQITDFNTLDVNFHCCLWDGNAIGITNTIGYPNTGLGAGSYQIWDSEFKNHSGTAMKMSTVSQFYFYNVRSRKNAGGFLYSASVGAACEVWMQACYDDGTIADSVNVGNFGCLGLIDNRFQRNGRTVVMSQSDARCVAVGNKVGNTGSWIKTGGSRLHQQNTVVFDSVPAELTFAYAPKVARTVFEVMPVNATSIQSAINSAVATGNRAKVHIPYGAHKVMPGQIVVPKNTDIEILGDGSTLWSNGTFLLAASISSSPVITIERPTKATIRSLAVDGQNRSPCVLSSSGASDTQSAGGRITMEFCHSTQPKGNAPGVLVNAGSKIALVQAISHLCEGALNHKAAFDVTGPVKLNIWGTLAINYLTGYKINNADVIAASIWYESSPTPYIDFTQAAATGSTGSGTLSVIGLVWASTSSTVIDLSRFDGDVLLACAYASGDIVGSGSGLRCLALGINTGEDTSTISASGGAMLATLQCQRGIYESNKPITNANVTNTLVTEMLANVRAQALDNLNVAVAASVSDLRIHDVWAMQQVDYGFKHAA